MNRSEKASSRMARLVRTGLAGLACVAAMAGSSAGCLDRPVSPATPNTTNVFVQDIKQTTVDKIDLLFMIDNSISMADKQEILAAAVPELANRLIQPATDPATGQPEFQAVVDIHIGIISSSIGGHGGDQCSPSNANFDPTQADNAHLMPSVRQGLASYNGNNEFLWWDPTGLKGTSGPGENDPNVLNTNFAAYVTNTGENGCGYEASLEAWYRFLVDPNPPANVTSDGNNAVIEAPDQVVLQQRNDFLRQDSLVAIIMLSDENDCSIIDGGFNWIAAQTTNSNNTAYHLPRATTSCNSNPNDACCQSCASQGPNPGCPALAQNGCDLSASTWDDQGDHPNLRCWQQKRRFGIDFLYPTRRYVEGLTQPRICLNWDAGGPHCAPADRVPNPLFNNSPDGSGTSRDPNLIYIAGIVGLPWQDVATDDTLTDPAGLKYLTASEMTAKGRWDWLVPACKSAGGADLPRPISVCDQWDLADPPDDPLMIESTDPRTGQNPAVNAPLVDENGGELANPINGHEWNTAAGGTPSDLQYACIFKLATPEANGGDCDDALTGTPPPNSPLCQSGGSYSTNQIYAKAYPGQRELEVLKDFGTNSIVASICPKITTPGAPGYGYNPAVDSIIERLKEVLAGKCVNRPVDVNDDGTPKCKVVEVQEAQGGCQPCDSNTGRSDVDPALVAPVLKRLKATAQCGPQSANLTPCDPGNWCMCTINYASMPDDCLHNDPYAVGDFGWCYIDYGRVDVNGQPDPIPSDYATNPGTIAPSVNKCAPARQLRFVGDNTPANGATVFLACLGAPVS
jgi:hypothetical protein